MGEKIGEIRRKEERRQGIEIIVRQSNVMKCAHQRQYVWAVMTISSYTIRYDALYLRARKS